MLTQSNIPLEKRIDLDNSQKRMWRTLIRVISLNKPKGKVGLILPGWDVHEALYFKLNQLPKNLRTEIYKGYRFHSPTNLSAKKASDLYIDINSYEPN